MNKEEFYRKLELDPQVILQLDEYEKNRSAQITPELTACLDSRALWEDFLKGLKSAVGPDPEGMSVLWEMLDIAMTRTLPIYERKGIPEEIFTESMKFCTRAIRDYRKAYGRFRFEREWWFPRQLCPLEFRVGVLEYEYVETPEERYISVHIPSDADFSPVKVDESLRDFDDFCGCFCPEWRGLRKKCISWMMVPALGQLLKSDSNIMSFQNRFQITGVDPDATGFLGWVYPGFSGDWADLPEDTSLRREMKKYLLNGGKIGSAEGILKEAAFR